MKHNDFEETSNKSYYIIDGFKSHHLIVISEDSKDKPFIKTFESIDLAINYFYKLSDSGDCLHDVSNCRLVINGDHHQIE